MRQFNSGQAAMAYRRTSAMVSPATAVVLLYERAILRLRQAILALDARRFEESFNQVTAAVTILRGLSMALDFDRGGAVAERLDRMYSRNIMALLASVGKADARERYQKIANGLASLREAWIVVAREEGGSSRPRP